MPEAVPIADPAAEIASWWRLVELGLPSHEGCGALTFAPAGAETFRADWERWLDDLFVPVLHPALVALQSAAAAQDLARLVREDAALETALPEEAAGRSRTAGQHLILSHRPPQGAKLLERWRDRVSRGEVSGHLVTVFAARGEAFHLPFVQLCGALLLAECVLGADAVGVTLPAARTVELLQGALRRPVAVPAAQLLAV